jgi:hypothetical protein
VEGGIHDLVASVPQLVQSTREPVAVGGLGLMPLRPDVADDLGEERGQVRAWSHSAHEVEEGALQISRPETHALLSHDAGADFFTAEVGVYLFVGGRVLPSRGWARSSS